MENKVSAAEHHVGIEHTLLLIYCVATAPGFHEISAIVEPPRRCLTFILST